MLTTAANPTFAMDVWRASQSHIIRGYARKLWRADHGGAEDAIQDAVLQALTREHWFDEAKGTLTTWLALILRSLRQAARSKGHRKGTVNAPRVASVLHDPSGLGVIGLHGGLVDPYALSDLCDPESILIARELAREMEAEAAALEAERDRLEAERALAVLRTKPKLTDEQVRAIRASDLPLRVWAKQLNVSKHIVYDARNRRTYRHVN